MARMAGKVALVTGAARGLGRAYALAMAREGADVVLLDIAEPIPGLPYETATAADLDDTVAEIAALGRSALRVEADIRIQAELDDAVARAITKFGKLDVCVANAGVWVPTGRFWEIDESEWDLIVSVNLSGTWRTVKAAAAQMVERKVGSIIICGSVSSFEGGASYAHYSTAKHGLLGLMRSAAIELGPYNVRCNAVCPGFTDTKINDYQASYDWVVGHPGGTPEDRARGAHHWTMLAGQGLLSPDSVAGAVLWLASDEAREVTGIAIPVDAGHLVVPRHNRAPVI